MGEHQDIIKYLEDQVLNLTTQLKRAKAALVAAKEIPDANNSGTKSAIGKSHTVPWKQHVNQLIDEMGKGALLTIDSVALQLEDRGVGDAATSKGRTAIGTTLRRMVADNEVLEKTEDGEYRIKKEPDP